MKNLVGSDIKTISDVKTHNRQNHASMVLWHVQLLSHNDRQELN